jgi:hypothetical protein
VAQGKKVENCWCKLEGSSTGSRWASGRAQEGLGERKMPSSMLVQAQAVVDAKRGYKMKRGYESKTNKR